MARPKPAARKAPPPKPSRIRAARGAAAAAKEPTPPTTPAKKRGSIGTSACADCGLLDGKHVPACPKATVLCGECGSSTKVHHETCSKAERIATVDGKEGAHPPSWAPASHAGRARRRRVGRRG